MVTTVSNENVTSVNDHMVVVNPVTGESIGTISNDSPTDVAEVVARARVAQKGWAATSIEDRCRILKKFGDLLVGKYQEHMIETIRAETGKARGGAYGETLVVDNFISYYVKHSPKWMQPESRVGLVRGLYKTTLVRKPVGVVGNISPWNFPLVLTFIDMVPALLAGNAVVVKPSEITPFTTLEAGKILTEAGMPNDVFLTVTGDGTTGAALIDYVDFIMFTGSTATGRKVATRAAERLIPFSLELGGNDPMIVLRDADINKAAASAISAGLENTGQLCMSVERVIVEEPVYEEFIQAMSRWNKRVVVGTDNDLNVHVGSLTNARELDRTQTHIQDALDKGARLVAGGRPMSHLGQWFHEPTILADVTRDMLVMQDETFGPVIAITKFKTADEAIEIANDTEYGLSASVWSRDVTRAQKIGMQIESGDVNINTALIGFGTPSMPFGGVKNSGFGRRNGHEGLYKYTSSQSVIVDQFPLLPEAPTIYTNTLIRLVRLARTVGRFFPFMTP